MSSQSRRSRLLLLLVVRLLRSVLVGLLLRKVLRLLRGVLRLRRRREAAEGREAAAAVMPGQRLRMVGTSAVGATTGHRVGCVHIMRRPAEEDVRVLLLESPCRATRRAVQGKIALLGVIG